MCNKAAFLEEKIGQSSLGGEDRTEPKTSMLDASSWTTCLKPLAY